MPAARPDSTNDGAGKTLVMVTVSCNEASPMVRSAPTENPEISATTNEDAPAGAASARLVALPTSFQLFTLSSGNADVKCGTVVDCVVPAVVVSVTVALIVDVVAVLVIVVPEVVVAVVSVVVLVMVVVFVIVEPVWVVFVWVVVRLVVVLVVVVAVVVDDFVVEDPV